MVSTFDSLLSSMATPAELSGKTGAIRRVALRQCIANWDEWLSVMRTSDARRELRRLAARNYKAAARAELEPKYGAVLSSFLILTVAGAALSWAVEKLLDWWWDHKRECGHLLYECQAELTR